MRVGYDISSIFGRNGIGRYSRELLQCIIDDDRVDPLLIGTTTQQRDLQNFLGSLKDHDVRLTLTNERALGAPLRRLVRLVRSWQIKHAFMGADVVHYLGPQKIFAEHPRVVSTVHDLIPMLAEFDVDAGLRRRFPTMIARQLRHSHAVVCPSSWVADTIREYFPWFEGQIHPTPLAAGSQFIPRQLTDVTKNHFGIERPFVVFVGRIDVDRKNLARILRAWQNIDPAIRGEAEFIVVTDQRQGVIDRFLERASIDRSDTSIRFLNNVATSQLVELLSSSLALVFASQAEGFGLPILEAMQCGCPVITSNTSSMPEVGGDAAIYVDPKSTESIQHAITRVLDDEPLRDSLRLKGLDRARLFSWQQTAQSTVGAYRLLLNA